jgi:hypothetical protein
MVGDTEYQSAQDFVTKKDPVALTGTYRPDLVLAIEHTQFLF